ncbi:MAG: serine protein kinase PrkA, partial [Desulfobacterales bacterium]|nr:serine protein kinase PrkA [Desulfobacterales bacterium]
MAPAAQQTLFAHIAAYKDGQRLYENAFQSIARMILESDIEKVVVNGKTTYDFGLFRQGTKPVVGMYDEINSFVSYVKDAAEDGSSKEMAYVLVGEPGNGKTYFVEYLCACYRAFLTRPENRRYTFRFRHLDRLGSYGRISVIESQTYEDPLVLAMNLAENHAETQAFLQAKAGLGEAAVNALFDVYRPLGACSEYIWNDIRNHTGGDLESMLDFVEVLPVPMSESLGTLTGKYPAKDKITSSAVDLLGEESIQRL